MATKTVKIRVNIIGKTIVYLSDLLKAHIYKNGDNTPIWTYDQKMLKTNTLVISFDVKEDTEITDYSIRLIYGSPTINYIGKVIETYTWSKLYSIDDDNMSIDFDLTAYYDKTVLDFDGNTWKPIYDNSSNLLGYGVKVTDNTNTNLSSQNGIVDSSFTGGTVLVELCSNCNDNSGTYLSDSVNSETTSIKSAITYSYSGSDSDSDTYSFSDSARTKTLYESRKSNVLYASGKSNKVFAIHNDTTASSLSTLQPRYMGPAGEGLKYDYSYSKGYSVGKCLCKSSKLNEWVSYTSTENKDYYAITVTESNKCIKQPINLEYGYKYTFTMHVCSEAGSDGIGLSKSNSVTNINNLDYATCSGIDARNSYSCTPTSNETIYLYFITNGNEIIAGLGSDAQEHDPSGCEYGDVEVTKTYIGVDVTLKENGVQGYLDNFDVPDVGILKTYISPSARDKEKEYEDSLPIFTTVESDDYAFGNIWTTTETYSDTSVIKDITNSLTTSALTLYAQNFAYFVGRVCKENENSELEPVSGIKVNFIGSNNTTLGTAVSDDDGMVVYTTYYSVSLATIQASLSSTKYMLDSSEDKITLYRKTNKTDPDTIKITDIPTDYTGTGKLIDELSKVSAYNIKTIINNGNADYSDDSFEMKVIEPDAVSTYDIFTSSPVVISNDENIVGSVDICLKSDANSLQLKTINRYSGYYNPIFKDILFYDNYTEDGTTSFSNTSFDDDYEDNYGQFGVINDMWMHKVNEDDPSKIVTYLEPYYPLIGQYALDYRDYNVFSSNWDMNYYTKQVDTTHNESCKNINSMKNGLCMFGSKYLNTPNEIEINCFNGCEEWNDDWITDTDGCSGEVMYKEKNNTSVEYYFFLRKRILRFFCDKLKSEFKKYINENYSYGETGLEDDIKAYVENNILKLYQLDKIRMFVNRNKSNVANNQIENDYTTYLAFSSDVLLNAGFEEVNTLSMSKVSLDDFDRKVVYNLRTGEKEDFGFSFKIKKI